MKLLLIAVLLTATQATEPLFEVLPETVAEEWVAVELPTPTPILSMKREVNSDGSYEFSYISGDGTSRKESGAPKRIGDKIGHTAKGSYSYTAPNGTEISVTYIADELGFRAFGAHIPTEPPKPAYVVKLLENLRKAGKL